ncbi:MAG: hypothetical protein LLG01_07740 [Planctomycetaceae bacterium]|nr:hypothetical protein [Planctomycetaceae bacterium]
MTSESVHPTGPHAGQSSSIDPRMAQQGRRFVQRSKKKDPQDSDDEPPHEAPPTTGGDEHEHQVDVLA